MKLQNVLLPNNSNCPEPQMLYRDGDQAKFLMKQQAERVPETIFLKETVLSEGSCIHFNTYFNLFSIDKWKKYTKIDTVSLSLQFKGTATVELYHVELDNPIATEILWKTVKKQVIHHDTMSVEELSFGPYASGCFSFCVAAENGTVYLGDMYYGTDLKDEEQAPVDLALNICTYRRETFVKNNLAALQKAFIGKEASELYNHLHVFVQDNGKTLDCEALSNEFIHVTPNRNTGGSGGFTRGLMEIMKTLPDFPATHTILMDDDITIEPESIFRTYQMLRCRKEEYNDLFIGGAMFRLDKPYWQEEAGAAWNAGALQSRQKGTDMRVLENCLFGMEEEYYEFNAWWYCCIPMSVVTPDNLPLPIFIRGDDVEYGMRNIKHLALLNGICVWHEPFENKYSSYLEYYKFRNLLYVNALHEPDFSTKRFMSRLFRSIGRELVYYRYKNVALIFRAVKDFYRGIPFLETQDGEALHKSIMASGYKAQPIADVNTQQLHFNWNDYRHSMLQGDRRVCKAFRFITLNGFLLHAKRSVVVDMAKCRPINYYRAKKVMNYNPSSKTCFITEKSVSKHVYFTLKLLWQLFVSIFRYPAASKRFRRNAAKVTNMAFWEKYLGI